MRYETFMAMAAMPSLAHIPFPVKAQVLLTNGEFADVKIDSIHWNKPRDAVAIKFLKPDPIDAEVYRVQTILTREGISIRNVSLKRILELTGLQPDTTDGAIARIPKAITNRLSSGQMDDLKAWLAGGGQRRIVGDLHAIVGNNVLAVHKAFKGANNTGRVVVTPAGHSIAYTTAKEIWRDIQNNIQSTWTSVSTGEYFRPTEIQHSPRRIVYNRSQQSITIGCQTIPYSAFADLARREGW